MRRTWADAARTALGTPHSSTTSAAPQPPATAGAQQNPVRSQLQALTTSLTQLHEKQVQDKPAAPPPAAGPVASPGSPDQLTKTQAQARVKYLEAALAALPPDDAELGDERASLTSRLAEAKRRVHGVQPIGARLDGARAALERSRSRQAEAAQAVAAAQLLHQQAAEEVAGLEREVHDIEASLAAGTGSAEMDPVLESAVTPVDQAHAALNEMVTNLANDSCVHPAHLEAAKAHVKQLFDGFRLTLQQAEATRAAAAGAPIQPAERRHVVKSPPAAPLPAQAGALVRHQGKQPRKELITDFFTRKKVIRTIGKDGKSTSSGFTAAPAPPSSA